MNKSPSTTWVELPTEVVELIADVDRPIDNPSHEVLCDATRTALERECVTLAADRVEAENVGCSDVDLRLRDGTITHPAPDGFSPVNLPTGPVTVLILSGGGEQSA